MRQLLGAAALKIVRRGLSGTARVPVFKRDDANSGIPNRGEQMGNIRWSKHRFASREEMQASVDERSERRQNRTYKAPFTYKRKWKVDPQWRDANPHIIINRTMFAQIKVK